MSEPQRETPKAARNLLRKAMAQHTEGDIATAIESARQALAIAPDYAEARSYIGSTLVMRQGRYADGLAELERACDTSPEDPALWYTLGWCYEFAAHGVSRRPKAGLEPDDLYQKAEAALRRCLHLHPEGKLRDDAKDILSSIIKEDVE